MMSELLNASELEKPRERPFPWHCPKCRQKEVRREAISYQCQRIHDGQPVTIDVTDLKVPRCGNCGELVFDYFAEEQINAAYGRQFPAISGKGTIAPPGFLGSAGNGAEKQPGPDTENLKTGNIGS